MSEAVCETASKQADLSERISFAKESMASHLNLVETYIGTLTGVVEDFWESHVTDGVFYLIRWNQVPIGFFTIYHSGDMDPLLTSLYMERAWLGISQTIMEMIIRNCHVTHAYVPTCDELFLSLCLDVQTRVELQAYFFDGTEDYSQLVRPAEYGRSCFKPVTREEMQEVRDMTGDFFDDCSDEDLEQGRYQMYRLEDGGETLGFGIMVPNRLQKGYTACGEIVLWEHRRKGAARSIQIHLGNMCREAGQIPVGGCWYQNTASKRTFDSCGKYSHTRLVHVYF